MGLFKSKPTLTTVSGCRTIHGIKNLSKATMYSLQALAIPGSRRGKLTAEQIVATCDSILSNHAHIINDCKQLIANTENPKVFYERYDLLLSSYSEMTKYEPYVKIYGYQPTESLTYYQTDKSKFEKKMIDRCYNKALIKADTLKTEKGKKNQFVKAYEALLSFSDSMQPDNKAYMVKKFGKQIV